MPFTQNFYGSIGTNANIENLDGTLTINGSPVLTASGDAKDLSRELSKLLAAVEGVTGIDAETKTKVAAEIKAADQEVKSGRPDGNNINNHLETASQTLKNATDTASNAFSLAKVLLEVGKWAIAIFV
jgi:hypothetical protein